MLFYCIIEWNDQFIWQWRILHSIIVM
jgi:hypothetical protein